MNDPAMREREQVVAWLRFGERVYDERAETCIRKGWKASAKQHAATAGHYRCIAECIERGDHIKDTQP